MKTGVKEIRDCTVMDLRVQTGALSISDIAGF